MQYDTDRHDDTVGPSGMTIRTPRELSILRTLTSHTRGHVLLLLDRHPLLVVSSGLRSVQHNRDVGGVPNSFHLKGRAVDLTAPLYDLQAAAKTAWAQRLGPTCTGPEEVLLEHSGLPGQHLHCAW